MSSPSRLADRAQELAAGIESLYDLAARMLEELKYVDENDSQVDRHLIHEAEEMLK